MCTAISYQGKDGHFFGRNLDLHHTYEERVTITPRNYAFSFRGVDPLTSHYAMIGMATVVDGYPLYYEATNEHGLSIAGLNFPVNASYLPWQESHQNIAPFEFIPWVLGQCRSLSEVKDLLRQVNLWDTPFSPRYPLSPLHWIISDASDSIIAEPMADGLHLYNAPIGLLTNEPPYPYHLYHLADFQNLHNEPAIDHFTKGKLRSYSNGMGALGLPGDYSSASRFVKAAFLLENAAENDSSVSHFFHILAAVAMPSGAVRMQSGEYEITHYSSCCDTAKGIYYYTTYDNCRIVGVSLHNCDLDGNIVTCFPLRKGPDIFLENHIKENTYETDSI